MVTLLASRFRSLSIPEELIGKHGLGDMHTTVVYEIDLQDLSTCCFYQGRDSLSQRVIAHMPKVKGLIGIRAGELNHDTSTLTILRRAIGITSGFSYSKDAVSKLWDIETDIEVWTGCGHLSRRMVILKLLHHFGSYRSRCLMQGLRIWEHRKCSISHLALRRKAY